MKVLAIVQARMGSNRLPGKVMKNIDGHPMIYYTLTRLKKCRYIDEIILATSTHEENDSLAQYVSSIGIPVFRGDEDNVLERYKLASDKYSSDIIIRVTGDCPLIDPVVTDHVITNFMISAKDYVRLDVPNTFPRGFDTEVFSKKVLDEVYEKVQQNHDEKVKMYKEHVTYYIYTHPEEFKVGYVKGDRPLSLNLSVDTKEDFDRVKELVKLDSYQSILNKIDAYEK